MQDQSNMDMMHDYSTNQEEQGDDDASSSSSASDSSIHFNKLFKYNLLREQSQHFPTTNSGWCDWCKAATDYWLALRDTAKKLKEECKQASKRKKKSKLSANVLFRYLDESSQ